MKKYLPLFLFLAYLAVSCSPSPEKKAEALIKEAVLKTLVLPETYQSVETKLDSAFTPIHDPKSISAILDLFQNNQKMELVEEHIKYAKSQIALWSSPLMKSTTYGREQYQQAKEEYDSYQETYEKLSINNEQRLEEIGKLFNKQPEYIGYRAHHRFRANDNDGTVYLSGYYFLFDKELSQIVAQWDEEDIDTYNEILKQAQDAFQGQQ